MKTVAPLFRVLVLLAVALAGIVMAQERLIYFPERAPLDALLPPRATGIVPWPSAADFRGLLAEPAGGHACGTIVVFHGNAGHAGQRLFYVEMLKPLGWRVLLAEYPGYGPRDGELNELGEESLVADAAETVARVRRAFPGPLYLLGESLGAGVAAAASGRLQHAGISGLVLVTPWDALGNVAAHHYPWLPRSLLAWLLPDRYDSAAHLSAFPGRVAVVVAESDDIVPAKFGRALFDALDAATDKRLLALPGAGHNDWPDRVALPWWQALSDWLLAVPAERRKPG